MTNRITDNIGDCWRSFNRKLDGINVEDLAFTTEPNALSNMFHHPIGKHTKHCKRTIDDIEAHLDIQDGWKILEVGGGYGNLCRLLSEKYTLDYTLLDTPSMARLAKAFLNAHDVPYAQIMCDNYEDIRLKEYDLYVSVQAISETPKQYRESVLDIAFDKCKAFYMIEGNSSDKEFLPYLITALDEKFGDNYKNEDNLWVAPYHD